jgi:hypothetical protein
LSEEILYRQKKQSATAPEYASAEVLENLHSPRASKEGAIRSSKPVSITPETQPYTFAERARKI